MAKSYQRTWDERVQIALGKGKPVNSVPPPYKFPHSMESFLTEEFEYEGEGNDNGYEMSQFNTENRLLEECTSNGLGNIFLKSLLEVFLRI